MNWIELTSEEQLSKLIEESQERPVIIFKHSPYCGTSAVSRDRLLGHLAQEDLSANVYWVDVVGNRGLSRMIESIFQVIHQSPQLLLIREGKCSYDASHFSIRGDVVKEKLALAS